MSRAAAASLVALGVAGALLAVLHVLRPDLDWRTDYMSEFALGPHAWAMRLAFVAVGASGLLLALALQDDPRGARALLAGWGAGMALLAAAPAKGAPHLSVLYAAETAYVAGIAWLLAARRDARLLAASVALGAFAAAAFLATEVVALAPLGGAAQRVSGIAAGAWTALVAAGEVRRRGRRGLRGRSLPP